MEVTVVKSYQDELFNMKLQKLFFEPQQGIFKHEEFVLYRLCLYREDVANPVIRVYEDFFEASEHFGKTVKLINTESMLTKNNMMR